MEENRNNSIRPAKIRIVNPTPKTSQPRVLLQDQKPDWRNKLNLLIYIVAGSIVFLILNVSDIWEKILPGANNWKSLTLTQVFYLILVFVIPCIIYLFVKPELSQKLTFKINRLTAFLSILIGIPFAYLMAVFVLIISIILQKIGVLQNLIVFGKEIQLFPSGNPIYSFIFIVVICLLPALVIEIPLRGILFEELLHRKKQTSAIFFSALVSGLLVFQLQEFIPFFGLGWLTSLIYLYQQSIIASMLCHFSFNFTYYFLIVRIKNLNLNILNSQLVDLESLLPTIGKALIALTIFVPLFVILSQTKHINPILNSDKIIARHSKKNEPGNKLLTLAIISLLVIFIIFTLLDK